MGNISKSNLIRIAITEYIMKYKDLLKKIKNKLQYIDLDTLLIKKKLGEVFW